MGNTSLVYRQKLRTALYETRKHLHRIDIAFSELSNLFPFPVSVPDFQRLLASDTCVAFADQAIYRFSKAQDSISAKVFKSFLLFQGEKTDRPFLDILTSLEKIDILSVDTWFELREIRNEISHDYEDDTETGRSILNSIFEYRAELQRILNLLEANLNE